MKGVILAGGNGTRLKPLTDLTNKHLLPVHNKQMIMYPIQTLKDMGVTDILIVTGKDHAGDFIELLGSGVGLGCKFTYKVQDTAGGIAHALLLAEDFVDGLFVVILGDNIFERAPIRTTNEDMPGIVVKEVEDPERFGVYHNEEIEEKPVKPKSNMAVLGLYFYYPEVFNFIKKLKPSKRGELEITDVNNWVLQKTGASVTKYKGFWSDAGTFDSLAKASEFMKNHAKNK